MASDNLSTPKCCCCLCDRMVKRFIQLWPYTTIKICPTTKQMCQGSLKLLSKCSFANNYAKADFFAKSGHTGCHSPPPPGSLLTKVFRNLLTCCTNNQARL